ncbi:HNH homing endonuclease [Salmonella phage vB_Sen_I1]|uniref:HNH homing endonuclease n=1 Tax=Salmonella phage vB_Sen_I1 TaxID=2723910 RepID=A0A7L5CHL5_9CAUD|nr:HNH homing endonuclease [Salmonella phage vB_Sen_I1]
MIVQEGWTKESARNRFIYNPLTGEILNRINSGRAKKGQIAGYLDKSTGYIRVTLAGKRMKGHQLAFLYMEGYIPDTIDHINRIKSDNRWCNLRESSPQENARNIKARSKSGYLGVGWHKPSQKWWVYTKDVKGAQINGGYFDYTKLEEAVNKANELRQQLHGHTAILEVFNPDQPIPTIEELNR